jgi:hypothetical protein
VSIPLTMKAMKAVPMPETSSQVRHEASGFYYVTGAVGKFAQRLGKLAFDTTPNALRGDFSEIGVEARAMSANRKREIVREIKGRKGLVVRRVNTPYFEQKKCAR